MFYDTAPRGVSGWVSSCTVGGRLAGRGRAPGRKIAMISRRETIRLAGLAALGAACMPRLVGEMAGSLGPSAGLFFDPFDLPRIRSNARTVLLGPVYREWHSRSPRSLHEAWRDFEASRNIIRDLGRMWAAFMETTVAQVVDPSEERRRALLETIDRVVALPKWDYLMDGEEDIGLMRASMAVSRLLFARDALRGELGSDREDRLLRAIAEKGAAPCRRTLRGMDDPESVVGWRNDPGHPKINDYSLERWPDILGRNNLRATATIGVGLAALALRGRDERAEEWLEVAESSARKTFALFSDDGSYFEGLSYAGYALRLLLQFCEAHRRLVGTIDWTQAMPWDNFVRFVAVMQAGRSADGSPDIVNFSDARASIFPCVASWIRKRVGNEVAQRLANRSSQPSFFLDFLWYEPEASAALPQPEWKNHRTAMDWVICRSGWRDEDAVLAFRSGPPANHEHADRNSFLFKIHGERLLNDHFGAAYDPKDPRWTLRLTEAHNAVLIGGRGHQYHEGEHGVSEGMAQARVTQFEERGRFVWWRSVATHGYRLVNGNVGFVQRTVGYAKPNIILVHDLVELEEVDEPMEARFFPDNRDGLAEIWVSGERFSIARPRATVHGVCAGLGRVNCERSELSLAAGGGGESFPYVELQSAPAGHHSLVTLMVAQSGRGSEGLDMRLERADGGWRFEVEDVGGFLDTSEPLTEVRWNES